MVAKHDGIEEEVNDLSERMRLLQQDRLASLNLTEAKIAINAEEITALRENNKQSRLKLTNLQKNSASGQSVDQAEDLKKELLRAKTEHDSLRVNAEKHKVQLARLNDEMKQCELESHRPNVEDTPLSRQISSLENRLDKATIKYNEAQSIRHTYEHIVKRLRDERIDVENKVKAIERTVQGKQGDFDELLTLSVDAQRAKEIAQQQLHAVRISYEENRANRENQLRERQQMVKIRRQLLERQGKSEINLEENNVSRLQHDAHEDDNIADLESIRKGKEILATYEGSLKKLQEATGVSSIQDVTSKILNQASTKENLMALKMQNQAKIEELAKSRDDIQKNIDELRYISSNGGVLSCQQQSFANDYGLKEAESAIKLERCVQNSERIESTLITLKAGVKHLLDTVNLVAVEMEQDPLFLTDDNFQDILLQAGEVLESIMTKTETDDISNADDISFLSNLRGSGFSFDVNTDNLHAEELLASRPYNQRVHLPSTKREEFQQVQAFDEGVAPMDEEEFSRDRIKKNSSQLIWAIERRKAKEKKVTD